MNKILTSIFAGIFLVIISLNFISAVIIDSVNAQKLQPGETGSVSVVVKNTLNDNIEDVSFVVQLSTTPFTTSGSSEDSEDEIRDDDEETFNFILKAPNDIEPGDYNIPYVITYTIEGDDTPKTKTGSFGITVSADTKLDFAIETKDAIIGRNGKITLEIINEGLSNAKSVSVKINPEGFELISKDKVFIGTINAEDSDLVTWDVAFKDENPKLNVEITYKDFDNKDQTETINIPFNVYTKDEALKLGLIKKNNSMLYFGIIVFIILIWIIYRQTKKALKKRANKSGR